ncbi:MAG: YidC/Oxa1 family membrane protein insertase [bacterium]|nr:YidC/Oxa1 family membrane protein insertase [bacterium]
MNFFIQAFNAILYEPLLNGLVLLYQYLPGRDFGIAVIVFTIAVRLLLSPFMASSIKSQKAISELQPKIQEVQQKFKSDKEKQARETMALYQKEKINPFGGCLPLLIQLPILIALYQVFWKGLRPEEMTRLYSFVLNPGIINPVFLNIIDLGKASLVLAVLAGITQFIQVKMVSPKTKDNKAGKKQAGQFSDMMQKQMLYFFPIFTVFILWKLPAAIGLYWTVNNLFSIGQQYLIFKPRRENLTIPPKAE